MRRSLSIGPTAVSPFKVLGSLIHILDFGFYGKQSCRGFKCFLVVTEAISNHRWTFCHQLRTTPAVKLILWIIQHLQIRTGNPVCHISMDAELFANHTFKTELSLHIFVEPTGAYSSSPNGNAEVSIKLIGLMAQCLLYGAQMDPSLWYFAVT